MKSKSVELIIRGIPRPLRDSFKSACDKRGKNMTQELKDHMFRFVSESSSLNLEEKKELEPTLLEKMSALCVSLKEAIKNQDFIELNWLAEALDQGIRNLSGDNN